MNYVLKRVVGLQVTVGGDEHQGWLPPGAARPLPTPIRHYVVDVEIQGDDASGYILYCCSRDRDYWWDDWYQSLADAESAAVEKLGITQSQWSAP